MSNSTGQPLDHNKPGVYENGNLTLESQRLAEWTKFLIQHGADWKTIPQQVTHLLEFVKTGTVPAPPSDRTGTP